MLEVDRADLVLGDLGGADDLDGTVTGAVARSHVGVQLLDSGSEGGVTELLVHVVDAGAGDVSQPDAVGLDNTAVFLEDLVNGQDLTSGLLQLVKTGHEVPEAGLGRDLVGGEDLHAEDVRLGVLLGGLLAPDDAKQTDRHSEKMKEMRNKTKRTKGSPFFFADNTERHERTERKDEKKRHRVEVESNLSSA